jgi:Type IV secretion system pilin
MSLHIYLATACNTGQTSGLISANGLPQTCANSDTLRTIFFIAFSIIGGIAFLFLVIAGARYTLARGNVEAVQKAKNQIQYSLIGLIIASLAAVIVNFVVGRLQ